MTIIGRALAGSVTSSDTIAIVRADAVETCAPASPLGASFACELQVEEGEALSIAVESPSFVRWESACTGEEPRCVLAVVGPVQVIASFCGASCD